MLRNLIKTVRAIRQLPRVEIQLWGGELAHRIYKQFTRRHPRLPVIPYKAIGVALLELPADLETYLKTPGRGIVRDNRKKALKAGYTVRSINPLEHLEAILGIHNSLGSRAEVLPAEYFSEEGLRTYYQVPKESWGAFDAEGSMVAYADLMQTGEIGGFSRLIGHADSLKKGVVYLLTAEILAVLMARRAETGQPKWVMHDTYFGAAPGLKAFKDACGFTPKWVRWKWMGEQAPASEDAK